MPRTLDHGSERRERAASAAEVSWTQTKLRLCLTSESIAKSQREEKIGRINALQRELNPNIISSAKFTGKTDAELDKIYAGLKQRKQEKVVSEENLAKLERITKSMFIHTSPSITAKSSAAAETPAETTSKTKAAKDTVKKLKSKKQKSYQDFNYEPEQKEFDLSKGLEPGPNGEKKDHGSDRNATRDKYLNVQP